MHRETVYIHYLPLYRQPKSTTASTPREGSWEKDKSAIVSASCSQAAVWWFWRFGDLFTDRTKKWRFAPCFKVAQAGHAPFLAINKCEACISGPTRVLSHIRSKNVLPCISAEVLDVMFPDRLSLGRTWEHQVSHFYTYSAPANGNIEISYTTKRRQRNAAKGQSTEQVTDHMVTSTLSLLSQAEPPKWRVRAQGRQHNPTRLAVVCRS